MPPDSVIKTTGRLWGGGGAGGDGGGAGGSGGGQRGTNCQLDPAMDRT